MAIPIRARQIGLEKRCGTCKQTRLITEFYVNKRAWDGLSMACKSCAKQSRRDWAEANPERKRENQRRWRAARHWREYGDNRGPRGTKRRDARATAIQIRADFAESTGIPLGTCQCGCGLSTKLAKHTSYKMLRLAGDPSLYLKGHHPQEDAPRRVSIRQAAYKGDARLWVRILFGDPCAYCGGPANSIDHIVPVALGGPDEWDNLTPACMGCNLSKNKHPLLNFMVSKVST